MTPPGGGESGKDLVALVAKSVSTLSRNGTGRRPAPAKPQRRPLLARFSLAHGLMVVSGLLTFVLVASVLGDRSERAQVLVARADLAPGAPVTPEAFEAAELPADSPLVERIVPAGDVVPGPWRLPSLGLSPLSWSSPASHSRGVRPGSSDVDRAGGAGKR